MYLLASARLREGHVHLAVLPWHFGSCGPVRITSNVCFWVGLLLHRRAPFAFYPETTQTCITCGCSHWNEHGSVYLSSWLQCSIGLTRESHRALPYLKRGRGNLCDKRIYFSTGLFASRAGRKRLLESGRPAASLGRQQGGSRRRGRHPLGEPPRSPPCPTLLHRLARRRESPWGPAGEGKAGLFAVDNLL